MAEISSNQTDFFQDLFEPRLSKTLSVAFSVVATLNGLVFMYSIIWFEHYGSDEKRTLQVDQSLFIFYSENNVGSIILHIIHIIISKSDYILFYYSGATKWDH
jgi:uncharacterized membrane protein YdcZ (DUF606 family)